MAALKISGWARNKFGGKSSLIAGEFAQDRGGGYAGCKGWMDLKYTAVVKEIALAAQLVPPLHGELTLMPCQEPFAIDLDTSFVRTWASARKEANCIFQAESATTIPAMVGALQRHGRTLLLLDRSFKIEVAWMLRMKDKSGAVVMQERLLGCLPTDRGDKSLETSVAEVKQLECGDLGELLGTSGQGSCHAMLEILMNLAKGIPLAVKVDDHQWLHDIFARFFSFGSRDLGHTKIV